VEIVNCDVFETNKKRRFFSFKKIELSYILCFNGIFTANKMYIEHPNGNYGLYGLNMIGCDSIIRFNGEILKFHSFKSGTNLAIYVNEKGEQVVIDVYDKSLGITRMTIKQ
jgi:hypothetical protein